MKKLPPNEKQTEGFYARLNPQEGKQFRSYSKKSKLSFSEVLRNALYSQGVLTK